MERNGSSPRPRNDRPAGTEQPTAVVTGASSGIGLELARCCAASGFRMIIAADEPEIEDAAAALCAAGSEVTAVRADLSTRDGVEALVAALDGAPVDALLANAGLGLGGAFLDQDFDDALRVLDTNVTGTLYLLHHVARGMRDRGEGRILLVGSIVGLVPGAYQAVYAGTKAFLDSFCYALGEELRDSGVTVTCLMPGATDTSFFERADMLDTRVGRDDDKADPAKVAKDGFEAMMAGRPGIVSGTKNKLAAAASRFLPDTALARFQGRRTAPGTSER